MVVSTEQKNVTQARSNLEEARQHSLKTEKELTRLTTELNVRTRTDRSFVGTKRRTSSLMQNVNQAIKNRNKAKLSRKSAKVNLRRFEEDQRKFLVKSTKRQTQRDRDNKKRFSATIGKLKIKGTKKYVERQIKRRTKIKKVSAKSQRKLLTKPFNRTKIENKLRAEIKGTKGKNRTQLIDHFQPRLQQAETKVEKRRIIKIAQKGVTKPIISVQDFLVAASKKLNPKEKGTRKRVLDKLENVSFSSSLKKDSIIAGLGIGTAQILRNPVKYYSDEELQDAVDLINRPVKTISDTARFAALKPRTYAGEVAAEILFFGAAEKGLEKIDNIGQFRKKLKSSKKLKKVNDYLNKKSKKFRDALIKGAKKVSSKTPLGRVAKGAETLIKAKRIYKGVRNAVILTHSKAKASGARLENAVKNEVKKALDAGLINKNVFKEINKLADAKKQTPTKDKLTKFEKGQLNVQNNMSIKIKEVKGLKNTLKSKKLSKTNKKSIEGKIKAKEKQIVKLKEKQKQKQKQKGKTKLKEKQKQKQKQKQKLKQRLKQKLKQKQKQKQKEKLKEKQKQKLKQKQKQKEKLKPKLKFKAKQKRTRTKKAKISLSLDKGKSQRKKTFKRAKKKAEKHLINTKGLQTAKIKSSKVIKKIGKKKPNIKYSLGKKRKTLNLVETKPKKKKATTLKSIKKKTTKKRKSLKGKFKKASPKKLKLKKNTLTNSNKRLKKAKAIKKKSSRKRRTTKKKKK